MPLAAIRRGSALGLALAFVVGGTALADTVRADADTLAGVQGTVDIGPVDPGAQRTVDIDFVLECSSTSHVSAGATIPIESAVEDAPAGGSLVVTPGSLVVPAAWPADGDACTGNEPAAVVSPARLAITAPVSAGTRYAYSVIFALPETEPVANTIAVTVYLDVVAPPPVDTTDPVLAGIPDDITVTTAGDSAVVTWPAPTATDDTDDDPRVACDPASGSTFAIGTTTVTCRATDASGNSASAAFSVTVNRESAPPPAVDLSGTWGRPLSDASPALVGHAGRTIPLKLTVLDGSSPQGPASVAAPVLSAQRLDGCAGEPAGPATPAGTFAWADGAWQLNLDTSRLGTGCIRLTAVNGADARDSIATALVQLVPEAAQSVRGKATR